MKNNKDQFQLYFGEISLDSEIELESLLDFISGLEIRLKEGIKKDLLEIISIKGLGRVKARTLSSNGVRTLEQLINLPSDELLSLKGFGPNLIQRIKTQVGVQTTFSSKSLSNYHQSKSEYLTKKKRKNLFDFIR